jgi:hypothetical protein
MIWAAMVTVYYGVSCTNCRHFIEFGTYQADALGKDVRHVNPSPEQHRCPKCLEMWLYQPADVAHSRMSEVTGPAALARLLFSSHHAPTRWCFKRRW